jgi:hypothetical protein
MGARILNEERKSGFFQSNHQLSCLMLIPESA